MSFVHLHVHSHYSLLKASCQIPSLVEKAHSLKMPSIALTDYGNMFGVMEFYFEALKKNINPVIGCELSYLEDCEYKDSSQYNLRDPLQNYKSLVLLAQDLEGYKNLCQITTKANQKGFYFIPRTDYKHLNIHKKGLLALTGAGRSHVFSLFKEKGKKEAREEIQRLRDIFEDKLYLELLPFGLKRALEMNEFLLEMSEKLSLPLVATNDVHYLEKEDSLIQDTLYCIGTNKTLSDKERFRLGPSEFYLKTKEQMEGLFLENKKVHQAYVQACQRTLDIGKSCFVRFEIKDKKNRPILPSSLSSSRKRVLKIKNFKRFGEKIRKV